MPDSFDIGAIVKLRGRTSRPDLTGEVVGPTPNERREGIATYGRHELRSEYVLVHWSTEDRYWEARDAITRVVPLPEPPPDVLHLHSRPIEPR